MELPSQLPEGRPPCCFRLLLGRPRRVWRPILRIVSIPSSLRDGDRRRRGQLGTGRKGSLRTLGRPDRRPTRRPCRGRHRLEEQPSCGSHTCQNGRGLQAQYRMVERRSRSANTTESPSRSSRMAMIGHSIQLGVACPQDIRSGGARLACIMF